MATVTSESTAGNDLRQRLNDPKVVENLGRLLDHLETITFAVESADGFLRRGEVITESISEGVDELRRADSQAAIALLQKAPKMIRTSTQLVDAAGEIDVERLSKSKLLQRLTDQQTLETLNELLDKLPLIAFMLESLEGFIGRGETIIDNVAEAVGELKLAESGIDRSKLAPLRDSLPKMAEAGEYLLESNLLGESFPQVVDAAIAMLESGMLDKQLVNTLGELGKKSAETYHEVASQPVEPIGGLFATLKAMKDPDVQKSVGFFFAFAKTFAKHLK